jgi:Helix-turn-helix domain
LFRQQRARINVIGQQIHALELLGVLAPALDRTFSTLSDPTRRAILERLGRGPATISELAHPFGISLPGLLKHVCILEQRTW